MNIGIILRGLVKSADLGRLEGLASGQIANDNPIFQQQVKVCDIQTTVQNYHAYHQWQHSHWHPCIAQVLSLNLQMRCLTQSQSGVPLIGLVHVANRILWLAPLTEQETEIECQISGYRLHRRGVVLTLRTRLKQADQIAIIADSEYLYRCKLRANDSTETEPFGYAEAEGRAVFNSIALNNDVGRRYAQLSGDYNPIHLWPLTAKLFGFKRPIAHGMHTLALCISARYQSADKWQGETQLDAFFKAPAMLPCKLEMATNEQRTIASASVLGLYNPDAPDGQREILQLRISRL
ncbi:MaoC/PaaZ C-terminal domain-containing protein [Alteromonas sp. ASW11-36]|uniref:MaoC/PaaZ C-terminal domain-containing protein n=1 Tax=Alteromonas arenosi TaxID=3055817 RepID=A0ABT7SU82_9ALTE|nr:MaoC/PaaZ C-terminal domain-containing protein [Alteromonas sp. ASW11-36]MDM7859752.1 MaoC/PaaZ C-terminal domain-containing protein [Alteromonas sp. ASW11-36]